MNPSNTIPQAIEDVLVTHRRGFLKSAGLLAVSFAISGKSAVAQSNATPESGPFHDPDFHQIDSWIVIHENNTATFYVGKTDPGQGTGTAFRQLMSDELDIAFDKTTCIMGSTDTTVDQVGSGGSTAVERDSWPMRRVAAEARRVLLEMGSAPASRRANVAQGNLGVADQADCFIAQPDRQRRRPLRLLGGDIGADRGGRVARRRRQL